MLSITKKEYFKKAATSILKASAQVSMINTYKPLYKVIKTKIKTRIRRMLYFLRYEYLDDGMGLSSLLGRGRDAAEGAHSLST